MRILHQAPAVGDRITGSNSLEGDNRILPFHPEAHPGVFGLRMPDLKGPPGETWELRIGGNLRRVYPIHSTHSTGCG